MGVASAEGGATRKVKCSQQENRRVCEREDRIISNSQSHDLIRTSIPRTAPFDARHKDAPPSATYKAHTETCDRTSTFSFCILHKSIKLQHESKIPGQGTHLYSSTLIRKQKRFSRKLDTSNVGRVPLRTYLNGPISPLLFPLELVEVLEPGPVLRKGVSEVFD